MIWPQFTLRNFQIASLVIAVMAMPYSIKFCHVGVILVLFTILLEAGWKQKLDHLKQTRVLQLVLAFAVIVVIGILTSENKTQGWFKLESILFFIILPVAMGTMQNRFTESEVGILLKSFICTCLIGTLVCLYASFQSSHGTAHLPGYLEASALSTHAELTHERWFHFSYMSLASGIKMNPIYLSLYLIFCVLILLREELSSMRENLHKRILRGVGILYFSLFIVFLSSRIMILCLLILFTGLLLYFLFNQKLRKKSIALALIFGLAIAFVILNPVSHYKNWQELQTSEYRLDENKTYETSTEIRASLLWLSWDCMKEVNPILGAGIGDTETLLERKASEQGVKNIHGYFNPHNQYISLFIGVGFPGLLFFCSILLYAFLTAIKEKSFLLSTFIILFALMSVTEPTLERQKSVILFALFFPLLFFHGRLSVENNFTLKTFGVQA
jgi:O-antigen ligase